MMNEELDYSADEPSGQVTPISPLIRIDVFKDKSSSLGPNDHILANIELNLGTLFRSAVGENPNSLLNFNTTPTVTATVASGVRNLDDSFTMQNAPHNQKTETVISDHVGDSSTAMRVYPNLRDRDKSRNGNIASSI